jgi:hypothetical protein
VAAAPRRAGEASDRRCSKRLAPFLETPVPHLERHGALRPAPEVRAALVRLSPATIDRLPRPDRAPGGRRPWSRRRPAAGIRAPVPVRTRSEGAGAAPGAVRADLVAHCGESTAGFYLTTPVAVDVATSWVELEAVRGLGQQRVGTAAHHVRRRRPVPLRELHTDNGGEFLNAALYGWCRREGIRFTRGRPYTKDDRAYAEQKDWVGVRRVVGYGRYSSPAAHAQLQRRYGPLRQYLNSFQPVRKLVGKERDGARQRKRYDRAQTPYQRKRYDRAQTPYQRKRYDRAQTPYQRLLAAGVLPPAQRAALADRFAALDPLALLAEIAAAVAALRALAERPDDRPITTSVGNRANEASATAR